MTKLCPICGTPLKETTWGRFYCPNHGIINGNEELPDDEVKRSYIG